MDTALFLSWTDFERAAVVLPPWAAWVSWALTCWGVVALDREDRDDDDWAGEALAPSKTQAASTGTMSEVRRMRGSAENPELLQCRPCRLKIRVSSEVRLCPITGESGLDYATNAAHGFKLLHV